MKPLHVQSWAAYQKAMDDATIKVAFDIGANDGNYTQTLVENDFEVYAFEPVPRMFRHLSARFHRSPVVTCYKLGVSDKSELIKDVQVLSCWTIARAGTGGLSPKPEREFAEKFDMQTTTIDTFYGDPVAVGIIKLDTDGYEYRVLKGGEQTIRKWKPPILIELGCYLEKLGDDPKTFIEFIFGLGYDIWSMDGKNKFSSWAEVEPQYPHDTTHDVMLLPR